MMFICLFKLLLPTLLFRTGSDNKCRGRNSAMELIIGARLVSSIGVDHVDRKSEYCKPNLSKGRGGGLNNLHWVCSPAEPMLFPALKGHQEVV